MINHQEGLLSSAFDKSLKYSKCCTFWVWPWILSECFQTQSSVFCIFSNFFFFYLLRFHWTTEIRHLTRSFINILYVRFERGIYDLLSAFNETFTIPNPNMAMTVSTHFCVLLGLFLLYVGLLWPLSSNIKCFHVKVSWLCCSRAPYQQCVVLGVVQVHAESRVVRVGLQNMFDWCDSRWHEKRIHWFTYRTKQKTQIPHHSVAQNTECAQVVSMCVSGISFLPCFFYKVCQQIYLCSYSFLVDWMGAIVSRSCSRTGRSHQFPVSSPLFCIS